MYIFDCTMYTFQVYSNQNQMDCKGTSSAHLDEHGRESLGAQLLVHAQEVDLHHGYRVARGPHRGRDRRDEGYLRPQEENSFHTKVS